MNRLAFSFSCPFRNFPGLQHLRYKRPCSVTVSVHRQVSSAGGPLLSSSQTNVGDSPRIRFSKSGTPMYQSHPTKLVIFDKDGTLICYHSLYVPWARKLVKNLQDATGRQIEDCVYKRLGMCDKSGQVLPGILIEYTAKIVQKSLVDALCQAGFSYEDSNKLVSEHWRTCIPDETSQLQMLDDLSFLFRLLNDYGIKSAICTEDTRAGTVAALRQLGISQFCQKIVCGDDPTSLPKPSPHNLLMICDALNVAPGEAAYIGDRHVDMKMAQEANIGKVIGVLTGAGTIHELSEIADHVVGSVKEIIPLILPVEGSQQISSQSPVATGPRTSTFNSYQAIPQDHSESIVKKSRKKLVIFDKDGTLICFHSMWTPWAMEVAKRIQDASRLNLYEKVLDLLGVSHADEKIKPGLFAEGTTRQVRFALMDLLEQSGIPYNEAEKILDSALNRDGDDKKQLSIGTPKSIGDVSELFKTLKDNDFKIAVCTADARESTLKTLNTLGLMKYIDKVVCCDDEGAKPKPYPDNALNICRDLLVDPLDAVMVGDTKADVCMGKNAKLGLTVGVLSGVASARELSRHADLVIPSVKDLLPHILPCSDHQQLNSTPTSSDGDTNNAGTGSRSTVVTTTIARSYSTSAKTHVAENVCGVTETNTNVGKKYVIVGAGSAGCVLANRLSAESSNHVTILEAGPMDNTWKIDMPAALMYNLCDTKYNWYYHTVPQCYMDNRSMYWPRGRVLGGSSSLNAMVYIRGHALDYDRWQDEGAAGWSYANCLPYFRKSQTHSLGAGVYRGSDGPLHTTRAYAKNPLFKAFVDAGRQAGYPVTDDMNGYQQEGFGYMDMTIHAGQRWSASMAYLRPVSYRQNLEIKTNAFTHRIVFDGKRAIGVEYENQGQMQNIFGDEIILCGGAINSPQLLLLSGVGDRKHLEEHNISVVANLPGVGQNLQDHLELYVQQECLKPITLYSAQWKYPHNMLRIGLEWFARKTGDASTAHLEAGAFIRSRPGVQHPDIQFHFLPSTVNDHGRVMGDREAYQVHVGPMRSTSRGFLKLRSADPHEHPIIDPMYMSTEIDRWEMRQSIRLAREVFAQKAFDEFRGAELTPGSDNQTDEQLDAFIRRFGDSAYHPSCTCKMGAETDPNAVVDSNTFVFGLEGLRVVDASIMPSVVSGNLNGPTIMLAEKGADIILNKSPLPPIHAPVYMAKSLETQR